MKTEVYSWRLSSGLKVELERAARVRKMRMPAVLEAAAREWLARNTQDIADDEEQRRLHEAAAKCFGTIRGDDPYRSENVGKLMRGSLHRKNGRKLSD